MIWKGIWMPVLIACSMLEKGNQKPHGTTQRDIPTV
jgi:hypothetical protein